MSAWTSRFSNRFLLSASSNSAARAASVALVAGRRMVPASASVKVAPTPGDRDARGSRR